MASFDLEAYRRRAEQFVGDLNREHYQHFSGLKPECDFTAVYRRYPELFTLDAVAALTALYEGCEGDERRRVSYLLNLGIEGFMGEQTKELGDEIANLESGLKLSVDGEQIGYRASSVVQANEADRDRRRRIHEARLEVTRETLNPRYDELWRVSHDLARELGYETYADLFSDVRAVDLGMLRAVTDSFLQDTEGLYQRSLDKLVRAKLGFGLAKLHSADFARLIRAPEYDHVFAADKLVPTFERLLADMGIDLSAQPNVILDAEPRELKSPRAFCAPARVPEEVYLVVMPKGGQDDYGALLHEGGHTEHFAHVAGDLPFEFRYLGDNAVTEGFAFMLDHLLLNPSFLEVYLDFTDSAEFLSFANVVELYFLRRYAGKLAYETELHAETGSLENMAGVYHDLLSDAIQVDISGDNYLVDVDEGLYCTNYLRAWMLEAAFRMLLQDRFGAEWFRDPGAGAWVRGLWAHGQHYNAEQLLLKYGGGKLDSGPLKAHIERALGR